MIADRVKDTSVSTGAGNFTLSGSPAAGFQALSAIGATGSTFGYVIDGGAEWEVGTGTITAANTFSRAPTASSNAGALVAFSAGTKTVFHSVTAKQFGAGIVDPSDVGFDIILLAGQSNMAGRGTYDALVDIGSERIMQFGGVSADSRYRTIFSGADPLHMPEGVEVGQVGPATIAARTYCAARPSNRRVLLVPTAFGGTTLVALTPGWAPGSPGGSLYEGAIAQANAAVTAALTLYPNSRFIGTLWHQGESDGDNAVSQASYTAALKLLIAGFRSRITGATGSWFVMGGLCPEGITAVPARAGIKAAHIQVATDLDRCAYVDGPSGMADTNHYTAAGIRILGARMGVAIETARNYTAPVIAATAVTLNGPTAGVINIASGNYTVNTDGVRASAVTVTPTPVTGITFTPSSVTLAAGSSSGTFTATSTTTGAKTIAVTNGGSLTNPSSITLTVAAAATVPATMVAPVATGGDTTASIALTAPSDGGSAITGYTVTSIPAGGVDSNAGSTSLTHAMTGLTNGTAYTFTAKATNAVGTAATASPASNSVTPAGAVASAFNPADKNASFTLSGSNLVATNSGGAWTAVRGTTSKTAGKSYFEMTYTGSNRCVLGIGTSAASLATFVGNDANGWGMINTGGVYNSSTNVLSGSPASFAAGTVVGVALDADAHTIRFYIGGVIVGTAANTVTSSPLFAMASTEGTDVVTANFGASAFAFTPPAGFSAWG